MDKLQFYKGMKDEMALLQKEIDAKNEEIRKLKEEIGRARDEVDLAHRAREQKALEQVQ